MKKLVAIVTLLLALCSLSACNLKTYDDGYKDGCSDGYDEGIEQGRENLFIDMWMASTDVATLNLGGKWETEHFALILDRIYDSSVSYEENAPYVELDLTLNGITIEECALSNKMFFNIYSVTDGNWNMVLGYDNYYDYTALQQLDGNHGIGKVRLYDDAQFLIAIIIIDSHIYTARYTV